jgi:hypothetical protein
MSPLIASRERLIALSGDWMRARLRRFPPFLAGYLETLQDGIRHAVATRAVEGKYVAEERPDVIGERRLQKSSRAVQSRLDGFRS